MTPHQAWYDKIPGEEHLRVSGCAAYAHVPNDERGKLDLKTIRCIMLGYVSVQKGYRLYDKVTQKILHSRNVTFNEHEITVDQKEEESAPHLMELDFIDGSE